ncbi:MAG: hypothetical protein FJ387_00045 [Verrucomicrobia bacterium]|nr:hypothetical protein [Verrucomicrobiota bacterium]
MIGHAWNPFLRYPRLALGLTALLCLPLLAKLAQFTVSSELRVLLEGDQRNLASYQKVREILAEVEVVVLSLECDEVFSPSGVSAIRRVSEAFLELPGVEDVKSLTHSYKPVRRGLGFVMEPFVPAGDLEPTELAHIREFSLAHPLVRNVMVSPDARHTLLTVTFRRPLGTVAAQRMLRGDVQATLAPFRAEGLQFEVLGLPLIEEEIRRTLRHDLGRFVPAAVALLILILWLTFRSGRMLAWVLASHLAVLLLLPGVVALGGFRLNVFSVMLFPMLTGIHLTLLAHLGTGFQRAYSQTHHADTALYRTLDIVFKPSALASLTTIIGLLSLTIGGVPQTREFGFLGALGLALVHGVTFGPTLAILKLAANRWPPSPPPPPPPPPPHSAPRPAHADWAQRFAQFTQQHRGLILAGAGLLLGLSLLGLRFIRTDIRAVEFLDPSSPTRQALESLDRIYGGINVVQIEFDTGAANGVNDLAFLKYLERVHRFGESRPDLSSAYSYAQLMAMIHQLWEGGRADALRLPDNPLLINLFVLALKAQNFPFLTALADTDLRTGYLVLRTRDMPADRYLALIAEVTAYAQNARPPNVTVSAARGIHSILEADRRILRSQASSAGLTLGVIGLALALLWRSIPLAAVSLLTNAIPVALVIAVGAYTGITLNSITVMVAAIALGIAVDNSIHFLTHWRDLRRAGVDPHHAVLQTLRLKGRPILWTGAILVAVFAVFWFSSFPPVVDFGLLSAIAFAGALAAVAFLLPALLLPPKRTNGSDATPPPSP